MNLKTKITLFAMGIAACLLLSAPAIQAQQAAGSITGTVTDPSGSAIAGATVTARNVDQGTT
ncbi:MAG: carboxypeptidase-like regulatory domain-containing protein, partial [Acidobacteriaceae bacterium]